MPVGGWYSTRSQDVARLHIAFAELAKLVETALDPDDTRTLMQELTV